MRLTFHINYFTKPGENLCLAIVENDAEIRSFPMSYESDSQWMVSIDYFSKSIAYKYQLMNDSGEILNEELALHHLSFSHNYADFQVFDFWNKKNFPENYLTNKVLENSLGNPKFKKVLPLKKHSHLFRLEAPIYNPDWKIVIMGASEALGNWDPAKAVEMQQTALGVWELALYLPENQWIEYKYGLKNSVSGEVFDIEAGESRMLQPNSESGVLQIRADHFFRFKKTQLYYAGGIAIPIFSLRSENGFGIGEFSDLKLLADWAKGAGLTVIQTLPINDTTANFSWTDSYPYAPISLYALHPIYISFSELDFKIPDEYQEEFLQNKNELNALELINYEAVIALKWKFLRVVFDANYSKILKDRNFKKFLKSNEEWLQPYAAFCILRDRYNTPDFSKWKTHRKFVAGKIAAIFQEKSKDFREAMLHCWVQFQLDKQLSDSIKYAHNFGISLKGDLPIGIYRFSVEAWKEPELYGMDFQAGAPPDFFTELGQNWGFPTYNWEAMKADGYQWWKSRFAALEKYFDAMRIDHILGFFRIWRIPTTATQALLGYFYPAVPITEEELSRRNIPLNYERFVRPFINEQILDEYFGEEKDYIKSQFLDAKENAEFSLKPEFYNQQKITEYFENNKNEDLKQKLLSLAANVLLIEEIRDGKSVFHPQFSLAKTNSYRFLSDFEKHEFYHLHKDYFFNWQDELWAKSAMEKLPAILDSSAMLICAEDLGFVPDSVPVVMDRLGILALKVQRMAPDNLPFYNPKVAGYLNVVTTSSHDSSTLRQWWQENRGLTQDYFNQQLHQWGTAPVDLEPYLAEMILKQHIYSDAMLAIFPIQDFFATDAEIANPKLENERINDPGNFPHYWRYRMHISLENLNSRTDFSEKIYNWMKDSGRV